MEKTTESHMRAPRAKARQQRSRFRADRRSRNENKEKIDNDEWSCYCDHFTITVKEWFRGKIPKDKVSEKTEILEDGTCSTTYKIICKDVKRKR